MNSRLKVYKYIMNSYDIKDIFHIDIEPIRNNRAELLKVSQRILSKFVLYKKN